jgi:hypothetical protein
MQHSPDKPVIVFVASRKLTGSVALALLTDASAADNASRFLHATADDLAPYVLHRVCVCVW